MNGCRVTVGGESQKRAERIYIRRHAREQEAKFWKMNTSGYQQNPSKTFGVQFFGANFTGNGKNSSRKGYLRPRVFVSPEFLVPSSCVRVEVAVLGCPS